MLKQFKIQTYNQDLTNMISSLNSTFLLFYSSSIVLLLLLLGVICWLKKDFQHWLGDCIRLCKMVTNQEYSFKSNYSLLMLNPWILTAFGLWMLNLIILLQTSSDLVSIDRSQFPTSLEEFHNTKLFPCWFEGR